MGEDIFDECIACERIELGMFKPDESDLGTIADAQLRELQARRGRR